MVGGKRQKALLQWQQQQRSNGNGVMQCEPCHCCWFHFLRRADSNMQNVESLSLFMQIRATPSLERFILSCGFKTFTALLFFCKMFWQFAFIFQQKRCDKNALA
jgi:hypothetical protein